MMEAARTSETLVNFYRPHGATTQKTAIFELTAMRTSNSTAIEASEITKYDILLYG
jgi:hypothetical protein